MTYVMKLRLLWVWELMFSQSCWGSLFRLYSFVIDIRENRGKSELVASQMALVVKYLSDYAGDIRDMGLIPGLGRSSRGRHGNPWYSCRENPMDRGTCWDTVHGVAKSQTQLKWFGTHAHTIQDSGYLFQINIQINIQWIFIQKDKYKCHQYWKTLDDHSYGERLCMSSDGKNSQDSVFPGAHCSFGNKGQWFLQMAIQFHFVTCPIDWQGPHCRAYTW